MEKSLFVLTLRGDHRRLPSVDAHVWLSDVKGSAAPHPSPYPAGHHITYGCPNKHPRPMQKPREALKRCLLARKERTSAVIASSTAAKDRGRACSSSAAFLIAQQISSRVLILALSLAS
jgi:hypothetical protein